MYATSYLASSRIILDTCDGNIQNLWTMRPTTRDSLDETRGDRTFGLLMKDLGSVPDSMINFSTLGGRPERSDSLETFYTDDIYASLHHSLITFVKTLF